MLRSFKLHLKIMINDELVRIWEEIVAAYFKALWLLLSWLILRDTKKLCQDSFYFKFTRTEWNCERDTSEHTYSVYCTLSEKVLFMLQVE